MVVKPGIGILPPNVHSAHCVQPTYPTGGKKNKCASTKKTGGTASGRPRVTVVPGIDLT